MSGMIMNFRRGIRGAFKSIKSNFKEYICFFLALIMVQLLFGTVTLAFLNNRAVEKRAVEDAGYDYHAQLTGMTADDVLLLRRAYEATLHRDTAYFTFDDQRADGKITVNFTGNVRSSRNLFAGGVLVQINGASDRVSLITSPLYDYDASQGQDVPVYLAILLLLSLLSFLLLTALFRIRINHFKFTYSIYMAFGGDFRKLLSSAFYEMLLITLFSYLPSLVLTYAAGALLYLTRGQPFGFYFLTLPVTLFCSLLCATLALVFPMRMLASGMPVKHMKAQDNSNLVSSPRKSKVILKTSPLKLELLSLWRIRKHIAILMISTVSFAALAVAGCYLADIYVKRTDTVGQDLSLRFDSAETAELFFGYFKDRAAKNGFSSYTLEKKARDPFADPDADSADYAPHVVIPTRSAVSGSFVAHPMKPGYSAAASLEIRPFDADAQHCFESVYRYEYKGDLTPMLSSSDCVIVSSSLANNPGNTLEPGDRIFLPVGAMPLGGNAGELRSFEMELEDTVFLYKEFTVAAVVENYSDYDRMLIYLPVYAAQGEMSAYREVMRQEPDYSEVNIYLTDKSDVPAATNLAQTFVTYMETSGSGSAAFRLDDSALDERVTEGKNYRGLILLISLMVFAVSPIAGFFSQILFYEKRTTEFDMIKAVGGTAKTVDTAFLTDGAVIALLSGVIYTALSYLFVALLCAVLNTPVIFALFGKATHASSFAPNMPLFPFFIGLALTVAFAFAEVWLCRVIYRKRANENLASGFTAEEER